MTAKQDVPQLEQSQIENLFTHLQTKVSHLEKAISYSKDVFRQLDEVANKLNPDAFHKNQPVCASTCSEETEANKVSVPYYHQSGIVLKFNNAINELELTIKQLDEFTSDEVRSTINFFKQQI